MTACLTVEQVRAAILGRSIVDFGITPRQDGFLLRLDDQTEFEVGKDDNEWWMRVYMEQRQ